MFSGIWWELFPPEAQALSFKAATVTDKGSFTTVQVKISIWRQLSSYTSMNNLPLTFHTYVHIQRLYIQCLSSSAFCIFFVCFEFDGTNTFEACYERCNKWQKVVEYCIGTSSKRSVLHKWSWGDKIPTVITADP